MTTPPPHSGDAEPAFGHFTAADGARHPLGVATLVGSGPECDWGWAGLSELHCVLSATPDGVILRSWHPTDTLVNGKPTAARRLNHGDVLELAGVSLTLDAPALEVVDLAVADSDEVQLTTLVGWLAARQAQWQALQLDVATAREELRRERLPGVDRARRRQLKRLTAEAESERAKAKTLARRYLKRLRAKAATERVAGQAERSKLLARCAESADRLAEREAHLSEREARLSDGESRLRAAWADFAAPPVGLEPAYPDVPLTMTSRDRRPEVLSAEVESLERRAELAAARLAELETRRVHLADLAVQSRADDSWVHGVQLVVNPQEVALQLATTERSLRRESADLEAVRAELTRRARQVHDERTVVAEQLAEVAVARHSWHVAELATVDELESIARQVHARELELMEFAERLERVELDRHAKAQDLWRLRLKLEAWQGTLSAREAGIAAEEARRQAAHEARAAHLSQWESSLAGLCQKWSAARKQEVWHLRDELETLGRAKAQHRLALSDCDELRSKLMGELEACASASLAAAEVSQKLADLPGGRRAARQQRLAELRYRRQFAAMRREVDARRAKLAEETAASDARLAASQAALVASHEAHGRAAEEARQLASERLSREQEHARRQSELAAESAQFAHAGEELAALRGEVERLAGLLHAGGQADAKELAAMPRLRLAA